MLIYDYSKPIMVNTKTRLLSIKFIAAARPGFVWLLNVCNYKR